MAIRSAMGGIGHGVVTVYSYDANGNRTTVKTDGVTTQSLTFNSANQTTTSGYAYDAAG